MLPCPAGDADGRLYTAALGLTKSGRPRLNEGGDGQECLVVNLSTPGFRGGSELTGDVDPQSGICHPFRGNHPHGCPGVDAQPAPEAGSYPSCAGCSCQGVAFRTFPGQIIAQGWVAQGDAGRMGGGPQQILVLQKDQVCRVGRSGRLYGAPAAHYYKWDGENLLVATWAEREASDIF